jgi:hypothetical protein
MVLANYLTPSSSRPISFLPTIGKVVEAIVIRRIIEVAKAYSLLPNK